MNNAGKKMKDSIFLNVALKLMMNLENYILLNLEMLEMAKLA